MPNGTFASKLVDVDNHATGGETCLARALYYEKKGRESELHVNPLHIPYSIVFNFLWERIRGLVSSVGNTLQRFCQT